MSESTPPKRAPEHAPVLFPRDAHGELLVGGQRLAVLAERVGQTPFYAYDRGLLQRRVKELRAALPAGIELHYAMKANPMPALVQWMAGLVDGIDVASAGELQVALNAGADPHEISFAGPGKRDIELGQAVAAGVLVNVETARELKVLAATSQRLGLPARVALRVNPDFELKGSGMRMSGGPKQFGIDAETVPEVLAQVGALAGDGVAFEGFHLFAGSQNLKAEAICEAQLKSYELALRLAEAAPAPVKFLNLGGGFGIPYFPGETRLDLAPIGANLAALQTRAKGDLPAAKLVIELGRYFVGEAGVYVSRIVDRKLSRGQVFLVADGGLHHHLSASGNFGQVLRKNYPASVEPQGRIEAATEPASVVGPLCTPLDLLADRMEMARGEIGDLAVVYQSGAYGRSASPEGFLGHPACVEVLV
jgi:diaminopimelate decarboxylase